MQQTYKRLTLEERYQIQALKRSELSYRKIAQQLNRSHSTILREINNNSTSHNYYLPKPANDRVKGRRRGIGPECKIKGWLKDLIRDQIINKQWSPEQISGRLKRRNKKKGISHESIYQFIFKDYEEGGDLYQHLRRKRKRRRTRKETRNIKTLGYRRGIRSIDERPSIVDKRVRFADFERDTIQNKNGVGPGLLTIVDRKSRGTKIAKVKRVNDKWVTKATLRLLKNSKVNTITNDNGMEFSSIKIIEKKLKTKVYFNHPHASYERGTNENTNGLIRQYFPKGTDFNLVSHKEVKRVENLLNNRPRKTLGYRTPFEVHRE